MKRSIFGFAALALLAFVQAQTSYEILPLPNSLSELSDGPYWDAESLSLYFTDLTGAQVARYDYNTKTTYRADVVGEDFASFIVPVQGETGKFVVGCGRRVAVVSWDGVSSTATVERYAYEVEQSDEYYLNEFWDGSADSKGRLIAGTTWTNRSDFYSTRKGTLYSFEAGKPIKELIKNVGASNGLTWNQATQKFYYVDSASSNVTEYEYDFTTGDISNPRVVFENPNFPVGLTIDTDGNVYVSNWDNRVFKFNPSTKEILAEIVLPTKYLTGLAFGGPNLETLYVGSSSRKGAEPAPAGTVYAVTGLGAKGFPPSKTSYEILPLPNSLSELSDGPYWDAESLSLYFTDLTGAQVARYDYNTKTTYRADVVGEDFASFIVPVQGETGKFVVGCGRRVAVVSWDGVSSTATVERYAYEVEQSDEYYLNEFWDGSADSKGRLIAGTTWTNRSDFYSTRKGTLYSFEAGKPIKELIKNVGASNGLTWNQATQKFYYVDSASSNVTEYEYDFTTGDISNPRVVFENPNFPVGLTIDTDGNVYVSNWDNRVFKFNPSTKEILAEIVLPTKYLTGLAFGGPNLETLYVGSSSRKGAEPAPAGTVYAVTGLGAKGFPPSKVVL